MWLRRLQSGLTRHLAGFRLAAAIAAFLGIAVAGFGFGWMAFTPLD